MKRDQSLMEHVVDQLAPLGGVTARYMFGGWGLFREGTMFALISDGTFYIRGGPPNADAIAAADLNQWTFDSAKGPIKMKYWELPAAVCENHALLNEWCRGAVAASVAAAKPKERATPRVRKARR